MNYFNYARELELKKYKMMSESLVLEDADQMKAYNELMSGANGQGPYASNYKQLVDKISKIIDDSNPLPGSQPINIPNGEITIVHDGGPLNGQPFITVRYTVDMTVTPIEFKIIPPIPASTNTNQHS